jgi:hypothetical protein
MQRNQDFAEGFMEIQVRTISPDDNQAGLPLKDWDDGFLAFADTEKRLSAFKSPDSILLWNIRTPYGQEGWLMEADLWRTHNGVLEEICMEREDDGLLMQHWKLHTVIPKTNQASDCGDICYYRPVKLSLQHALGERQSLWTEKTIDCMEIIHPSARLHIYLTTGGNHGQNI